MDITHKVPSKVLTPTGGFLTGYTHTLNPYVGCSFACSFCYVRQMPVSLFRKAEWGTWVDVKQQAAEKLRKELRSAKKKGPVTIFMSSATDPYQPVEYREQVTRGLLEVLVEEPPAFLFVQTRSPLVVRDLDLLVRLRERVRVSITVETDLEEMRRQFTPAAPPLAARIKALAACRNAGLDVQAAVSPLLPCSGSFAQKLRGVVDRVVLDTYQMGDGSGGKRTQRLGIDKLYQQLGAEEWYTGEAFQRVHAQFLEAFADGTVFVSQEGFLPNRDECGGQAE
ncbi:SPL family radical SAM protein [Brevibacillus dissolubilis]|uniref:SPL family radical SAM protein n=1 Tax=Brevibacillus dissolubilis TaxID=1844116 RepID=UPI00111731FA|nr:radical SAM protein [Brevibacillus dissolubilis]